MNKLCFDYCSAPSLHNTLCELTTVTFKFSTSSASGPDQIAYPLLSHLSPLAQQDILSIFNWPWSSHTFLLKAW